jgi:NAD(P)H-hydrate epimerase
VALDHNKLLTRAQVRDYDRRASAEYGIPPLVLMENAGRGAVDILMSLGVQGPVAICCGKGNNGGDGLVMARHLQIHGVDVSVYLFADPADLSPESKVQWHIVSRAGIPWQIWTGVDEKALAAALARAEWVVDALFGTGLQGPVRSPFDKVIFAMNAGPGKVLAVDIPSGLDADTGEPTPATVRAGHTVTFVAPKVGFAKSSAQAWLGQVHVIDIGAPPRLLREM